MAIYTRFGAECSIVAKHGSVKVQGNASASKREPYAVTLVHIHFATDQSKTRRYPAIAESLKADAGWDEVARALEAATYEELAPDVRAGVIRYLRLSTAKPVRARAGKSTRARRGIAE